VTLRNEVSPGWCRDSLILLRYSKTRTGPSALFRLPGRQLVGAADMNPYCCCSAGTSTTPTSGPRR
jgi:hypothetical protein